MICGAVMLVFSLVTSCDYSGTISSPSPPRASSRPSEPLVVVQEGTADNSFYLVKLVNAKGLVVASASGRPRSITTFYNPAGGCYTPTPSPPTCHTLERGVSAVPGLSVSNSYVYYLNGDSELHSLAPDGTTSAIRQLPSGPTTTVGFAVSPGDKRIAVSVMDFTTSFESPVGFRLYVEDLSNGRHHVDLFSSNTVTEWPVGWRGTTLVLAVGDPVGSVGRNPFEAAQYQVVDSTTGERIATLDCIDGPLVAAGTACYDYQNERLGIESWDGRKTMWSGFNLGPSAGSPRLDPGFIALAPDGSRIAASVQPTTKQPCPQVVLFSLVGGAPTAMRGFSTGWLDSGHLIVSPCSDASRILDVATGLTVPFPFPPLSRFVGLLPAGLG